MIKVDNSIVSEYKPATGQETYSACAQVINEGGGTNTTTDNSDLYSDADWEAVDFTKKSTGFLGLGDDIGYYKSENGLELKFDYSKDVIIKKNKKTGEILIENADDLKVNGTKQDDKITIRNCRISEINTKDGNDTISIMNQSYMDDSVGDNFNTGAGNDTVIIEDSTVLDEINTEKGIDKIIAKNAWLSEINSGAGNDSIELTDVTVYQKNTDKNTLKIDSGSGDDTITVTNSTVNKIDANDGKDIITISGNSRIAEILGGSGNDKITLDNSSVTQIEGKGGDDEITIKNNSYVSDLYGSIGHDEININHSNVERIEGGATADILRWFTGDDTVVIDNSEIGKTNTGSGNDEVQVKDSTTGDIKTGKGEDKVTVEDSKTGTIDTGKNNDVVQVSGSEVKGIKTGKGDDSAVVTDSKVGKVDMGSGNDDLLTQDSEIEEIEAGAGDDTVVLDNTTVTTLDAGKGNDIVDLNNGSIVENLDSGKGEDVITSDKSSQINNLESEDEVAITDIALVNVENLDEVSAVEAVNATDNITSQYSDKELTSTEQYYALTIDVFADQLESIKSQFERQENADGVVGDRYNIVKTMLDMGVTKQEIQDAITQQEAMISEMTAALNSEDSSTFEDVYKKWTGVEYNQEKVSEFLEYQQMSTFVVSGMSQISSFANTVPSANNFEELFNLFNDFYGGDTEKTVSKLNELLQTTGACVFDEQTQRNFMNVQIINTDSGYKVQYTAVQYDNSETLTSDFSEFQNVFKYNYTTLNQYGNAMEYVLQNEFKENFENTLGYSIDTLQSKYVASQISAFGTSNSFQKLIDEYCTEQSNIENQVGAIVQTTGMGMMVVGGLLTFVCPPAGAVLMEAGSYTALSGTFLDNYLDFYDSLTSKDGITEAKAKELFKETVVDAALYLSGRAINVVAEGAHTAVSAGMAAQGANKSLQVLVGWAAEVGTDTALSLLSDLVITGEVDIQGEGFSQLLGILSGIAGAKVKAYNESLGKVNYGDNDTQKQNLDDVDSTKLNADRLVNTSMDDHAQGEVNSEPVDIKTANDAKKAGHEMGKTVVRDGECYTYDKTNNIWLKDPESQQKIALFNWATDPSTRKYDSKPLNESAAADFDAKKLNAFNNEELSLSPLIQEEYNLIRQYGDYQTDWGTGKLLESNIPELQKSVSGIPGDILNISPYSERMILLEKGPWTFRGNFSDAEYRASLNVVGNPNIIRELDTFWATGEYIDINGNKIKLDAADMTKFSYKTYTDVTKWDTREDPITMYFASKPSEAMQKAITDISAKYQRGSLNYPSSPDTPWLSFNKYPNQEMIDDLFKMTENDPILYSEVNNYLSGSKSHGEYNISEGQYQAIKNIIEDYNVYKDKTTGTSNPSDNNVVETTKLNAEDPATIIEIRTEEMHSRGITDDTVIASAINLSDSQYHMAKLLSDHGFTVEESINISNGSNDVQSSRLIDLVENKGADIFDALNLTNFSSHLNDAQFNVATLLFNEKSSLNLSVKTAENFSENECIKVVDLITNKNVPTEDAVRIISCGKGINYSDAQYQRAIQFYEKGVEPSKVWYSISLDDIQFDRALNLLDHGCNVDASWNIAKYYSDAQYEDTIKLINDGYDTNFAIAVKGDINNIGLNDVNGISLCLVPKLETYWNEINITKNGERLDPSLSDWKIKVGDKEVSILTDNNIITPEYLDTHKSDFDLGELAETGRLMTYEYKHAVEDAIIRMQATGQEIPDKIYLTSLFSETDLNNAVGVFSPKNPDSIFLSTECVQSGYEFLTRSICHEAAHMADRKATGWISDSKGTFIQPNEMIYSIELGDITIQSFDIDHFISNYALTNNAEFVAEVTALISSGTIRIDSNGKYTIITDDDGYYMNAHMKKTYYSSDDEEILNNIMTLYNEMTNGGLATPLFI